MITNIFEKNNYKFPVEYTDDFRKGVNSLLETYINDLRINQIDDSIIRKIENFKHNCDLTLKNYLKGIYSRAFENFSDAIKDLDIVKSPLLTSNLTEKYFFRGRCNYNFIDYSDREMFHIPLDKRYKVSTQRFSFPGLPCLYLGASSYICWVELNRPPIENFQIALLKASEIAEQKKVIDLSHVPQKISQLENQPWYKEEEYLLYWPLLAICSIRVKDEDAIFKPEYIFPQLFLEYIQKRNSNGTYIGIKYASVKAALISDKQLNENWTTYVNYVFPVRSDSMTEMFCKDLQEEFIVEKNRSGKELQVLIDLIQTNQLKGKHSALTTKMESIIDNTAPNLYTHDGIPYSYNKSVFGKIDQALLIDTFE